MRRWRAFGATGNEESENTEEGVEGFHFGMPGWVRRVGWAVDFFQQTEIPKGTEDKQKKIGNRFSESAEARSVSCTLVR